MIYMTKRKYVIPSSLDEKEQYVLFTSHDDSVGNIVLDSRLYPVSDFLQSLKIYPLSRIIIMLGIYYSTITLWSTDSILLTSSESLEHETVTILTYFMKRSSSNKCRIIYVVKTMRRFERTAWRPIDYLDSIAAGVIQIIGHNVITRLFYNTFSSGINMMDLLDDYQKEEKIYEKLSYPSDFGRW
jgi:hypothetical protein